MRWVFEEIFASAGAALADRVTLVPAEILARHAWSEDERLDLFADNERSAERHRRLRRSGGGTTLPRILRARAGHLRHARRAVHQIGRSQRRYRSRSAPGCKGLGDLWRISPFTTLWHALGTYFHDQRLRQLFGRYATYCGSSPFAAPATLMLVAHVEQSGVWLVEGGMHRLAVALADLAANAGLASATAAESREICRGEGVDGVELASGERIAADAVIVNGDVGAIAAGGFGASGPGRSTQPAGHARCLPSPGRFSPKRTAFP